MNVKSMKQHSQFLRTAAVELRERLRGIDVSKLTLDPHYRDIYLSSKIKAIESATLIASSQLSMALCNCGDPDKIVLVDHGGGTGITGMLAKLAGVGTVVYNDIDPKFLDAARQVGQAISAESDHYVLGDFGILQDYLNEHGLSCDALVSYNVIEHIYDMDHFIANLRSLSKGALVVVMSSGANMFNPRYLRHVFPIQRKKEKEWRAQRGRIISDCAPTLSEIETERLVRATRYCTQPVLVDVVRRYLDTGVISCDELSKVNRFDPYGTNTCDPETGWWAEHLMNPWYLKSQLQSAGFDACVRKGMYGRPSGLVKRIGAMVVNGLVRTTGPFGMVLASHYTLWGCSGCGQGNDV